MASSKKFQAPRGTRDFYPADMAVRRYIESVWRTTSINHGFEEVEGPTIEHLDLYTHKSGPGIVSELFQVYSGKDEQQIESIRAGESAPYALRPEFTPTLARMIAARAAQLPKPIKWFAIPGHYRAERPQRGRLREFFQWNVDFVGGEIEPVKADAEVIACAVSALKGMGLEPEQIQVKVNHRMLVAEFLQGQGVPETSLLDAMVLIDQADRLSKDEINQRAEELSLSDFAKDAILSGVIDVPFQTFPDPGPHIDAEARGRIMQVAETFLPAVEPMRNAVSEYGLLPWCSYSSRIVRGLAYYTGTVFEIIADGERAVAGGGRYDKLIESFGGPSMPACGFGMGDVVLGLLLHEKGLLPEEVYMKPLRPHVFVISNGAERPEAELPRLVAQLRKAGFHVRHSYRSTRNVGKLLGEAGKSRARTAIILGDELATGRIALKDLEGGDQREVMLDDLNRALREVLDAQEQAGV